VAFSRSFGTNAPASIGLIRLDTLDGAMILGMADHSTGPSFCRLCIALCGIEVDTEDGQPVAVRGDPAHPISAGYTCNKGRALVALHHAPNRLHGPLLRVGNELVPVTWDEALADLGPRLDDVVRQFGTGCVGFVSGRDIDPLTGMPRQSGMAIEVHPVSGVVG
jgi:anaerobic selenocysteine-containing dehydrogenase